MRRYLRSVAASLIALVASSAAMAETPAGNAPGATNNGPAPAQNNVTRNTQFGDWLLVCRKVDTQATQNCEIVQSFTLNGPLPRSRSASPNPTCPYNLLSSSRITYLFRAA